MIRMDQRGVSEMGFIPCGDSWMYEAKRQGTETDDTRNCFTHTFWPGGHLN